MNKLHIRSIEPPLDSADAASAAVDVLKADPATPDADVTLEYLAEHIWVVGDPDEVTARLRRLREDVGGFGTLLVIGHEWEPRDAWIHSMRLLVDEVLPRL